MDFLCEEDPNSQVDDQYFGVQGSWYGADCDDGETPVRDPASIVNQLNCQEAQARKSDLQLACKLDELANSFRSGTPPNFNDDATSYSPGQTLNEFLCVLEKRLLEKTQSQEENVQDSDEPDYEIMYTPKPSKTSSPRKRRTKSPPRRLNFGNFSPRPGPSTRRSIEPPSSPDWKAMLHDSNEIVCYPTDRMGMYGMTAGDIWKRRAEGNSVCKCPSPPKTPVRQVQAIPVRCIPSPKFEDDESLLSISDLGRLEYCGCTVEEILRKKAKKRAKTMFDTSSCDETPTWHHRKLDDSSFWKCKRNHSRKYSPSRKKHTDCDREKTPDFCDEEELYLSCQPISNRKKGEDSESKKGASSGMTSEEWLSKSRSCSSNCCCDDLPQRVAEWTESEFGGQNDKGVNAGINCRTSLDKKPMLKRKPTIRTKKFRDTSYKAFVSGLTSSHMSTPKSSSRRPIECLECSSPELMTFMRERSRRSCSPHRSRHMDHPRTPVNRKIGIQRKPTPMKVHLVTPPLSYQRMDDYEF